jgi:hypothetical protein
MRMDIKKFNNIFAKVDEVFDAVDKFFDSLDDVPTQQTAPPNTATQHTHHVDFRARTKKERCKLCLKFLRMSIAILWHGKTQISFKDRSNK